MLLQVPPQDNTHREVEKCQLRSHQSSGPCPVPPESTSVGSLPSYKSCAGGRGGGRAQGETEAQRGCRHLPKGKTLCTHMSAQTQETEMAGQRHL